MISPSKQSRLHSSRAARLADSASAWTRLRHDVYVQIAGVLLVTPAMLLLCIVVLAPFVFVIFESFSEERAGGFGLGNYEWLFGPAFLPSLGHSLYIGIGSVVLEVLVAVPLALLLNQRLAGRGLLRALVTLPWAVPTISVATAFLWLGNTNYGLFNQVALKLGALDAPVAVLGDPDLALPAVTVAHAWKGLPLVFIIILSSLQSLSSQYLEAARVDGAWRRAQLRHVVLPHLRSAIALAAVLSGIYNFALFDITFLLTGGGPAGSTTTLPLLLYNQEFFALDSGRASAVGVTIFLAGFFALTALFGLSALARKRRGEAR